MTAARVLKLPVPNGAGTPPRKRRRFVPPKFKAESHGHYVVRFRHHHFSICPPSSVRAIERDTWRLLAAPPDLPRDENGFPIWPRYVPGCTTGGVCHFATLEAVKAAVLTSCMAIHDGVEIIPFPLWQTAEAQP